MRVGISTGHPQAGPEGPRRYARSLAAALHRLGQPVEIVELPAPAGGVAARRAWDLFGVSLAARRARVDVLHCTGVYPPAAAGRTLVLTVHDLAIRRVPETFPALNRTLGWLVWSRLARRAERFVAVSQATRDDLVALLGVSRDRVSVVHHGVDKSFGPRGEAEVAAVRRRHGLAGDYFLAVGTLQPRKNLRRVVEAFQALRKDHVPLSLAVVGPVGWGDSGLAARPQTTSPVDGVRYLGRVPDADLAALYTGATGLVYPSLYEGFGLPTLEAMACGCPVVASNRGALPEVVGQAGLLVDPLRTTEIEAAMRRLADDPEQRARLAALGHERARGFTWERAAEETLAVYLALADGERFPRPAAVGLADGRR